MMYTQESFRFDWIPGRIVLEAWFCQSFYWVKFFKVSNELGCRKRPLSRVGGYFCFLFFFALSRLWQTNIASCQLKNKSLISRMILNIKQMLYYEKDTKKPSPGNHNYCWLGGRCSKISEMLPSLRNDKQKKCHDKISSVNKACRIWK